MKKISDCMSKNVVVISPNSTIREIAVKMKILNCGSLPVCDQGKLVGMVTDRDLVTRCLANHHTPDNVYAKDIMTSPIVYCFENQDVDDVAHVMELKQIRRVVVLDANKNMVGIASLGDIALKLGNGALTAEILEKISQPTKKSA